MERSAIKDPAPRRRALVAGQRWIAGLFFVVMAAMCALVIVTAFALNASRAFIGGEGLWAKAQKRAVHHLLRHAATRDVRDFEAYEHDIAVPFADRRAREALLAPQPDYDAAHAALVEGRNHPDDAIAMVRLIRYFGRLDDLQHAMAVWTRADHWLGELDRAARALRSATALPAADPQRIHALVDEIVRIDGELTRHEDDFSATVADTARLVARIVPIFAFASAALLLLLGMLLIQRTLRRVHHSDWQRDKLFENSTDVFSLLDAEGRMHFVSPSVRGPLGYEPAELIGRPAADFIHPDDRELVALRLRDAVQQPGEPAHVEFRFLHRDGGYRTMEATGTVHGDDPLEIIVTSRDVTERRALERELLQAQKMESIGRLAGGIAHDFNNVLTALIGHAEEARAELQGSPRIRAELDEIVRSAERAAALTRQLLAFARRQVIAPKLIDIGALVLGLHEMLRRLLGDSIALAIDIEPGVGAVRADPGQIEQVVVNLAVNARDAMPAGGKVEIAAMRLVIEGAEPARHTLRAGEYVVLSVSDSGVGFGEDTARHLFEPFFTTKSDGAGTGLGLATCYGIVTQSGGDIVVHSEPGRGTRFDVMLPRASEAAPPLEVEARPAELPRGTETVLIVEDEPAVRRVTVRSLRAWGYDVLEAEDGEAALQVLASHASEVHLVVSDVMMPRLGGLALAERIASSGARTRVMLVSGYTNDAKLAGGQRAAHLPFLQKPFTRDALARAVRLTLDA